MLRPTMPNLEAFPGPFWMSCGIDFLVFDGNVPQTKRVFRLHDSFRERRCYDFVRSVPWSPAL